MLTMTMPSNVSERNFFGAAATVILVSVFFGFARSFYLKPVFFPDFPAPPETIFVLHGLVFSAWVVLLIVQTRLIAYGKTRLHRTLGAFGAGLAVAMVVLGVLAALTAARRPGGFIGIPIPPLQFLAVPMFAIALFALFVLLAIVLRRKPAAHKRLMLIGSFQMVTPAVARWPGVAPFGPPAFFGITDLFLIALVIFDLRTRQRLHPATLWGGLLTIVAQPVQLMLAGTALWLDFARWATGQP
jgi:hypothetical protein